MIGLPSVIRGALGHAPPLTLFVLLCIYRLTGSPSSSSIRPLLYEQTHWVFFFLLSCASSVNRGSLGHLVTLLGFLCYYRLTGLSLSFSILHPLQ